MIDEPCPNQSYLSLPIQLRSNVVLSISCEHSYAALVHAASSMYGEHDEMISPVASRKQNPTASVPALLNSFHFLPF